jgi:diguanylate cyclase (GGDEF)-like protein
VAVSARRITLDDHIYLYLSFRDISKEKEQGRLIESQNLKLLEVQEELKKRNNNLKLLIEQQESMIILTDGKNMQFANQKLFKFLGFEDLDSFTSKHRCVCELFIQDDRYFHLGKMQEGESWLEAIKLMSDVERIVALSGVDGDEHVFSIAVSDFDQSTMIVSFTDITQAVFARMELEDRLLHDTLTGAYSREYFQKNFTMLRSEFYRENFLCAIAMLDIDHFKDVNDVYGHDVGDEVLKEFVQVIHSHSRIDDILVRWGGEEFILIFKVKQFEDMFKVLDNLRMKVQEYSSSSVDHLTCSIGGSVYQEGENLLIAVKRSDEAMYIAKNSGRNKVVLQEV